MKKALRITSAAVLLAAATAGAAAYSPLRIEELGVTVPSGQSREYSYSDKEAGFYYGQTSADDFGDWYAGWNIRAKRIFADYRLYVDGRMLSRRNASVTVWPDRLERVHDCAVETFALVDSRKVLFVGVEDVAGSRIGLELIGSNVTLPRKDGNSVIYAAVEARGDFVRISALNPDVQLSFDGKVVEAPRNAGGFIISYGNETESRELASQFRSEGRQWLAQRQQRMQALLDDNAMRSDLPSLDRAVAWIELTADELVTRQHGGWGMYAGFPWFTDFWGRDMFIAMPGAVLCTGEFDVARDILLSFARYQDTDPESETYGRVPNRLNLDGILYNTTDGTPRFVIQAYEYLKYTGDVDFIKQIYPAVKTATDASARLFTDDRGYLTHADADTWMDAKRQGQYPCSPRGDRAVDIQALWYQQLRCAADMARYMGEERKTRQWEALAEKVRANFGHDFIDRESGIIYDHLNSDGTPDLQLRPNTVYAHELISDTLLRMQDTRRMWEHLVYPWGVSSLDQNDAQFHPWHEMWHRYHKDDAYHNGTVWLWLNGQAMQRMIEYGQQDLAFRLFSNMNRQALCEGAVGSLSECADPWPRPGSTWVRRSGTFLQAWSNGEHIRVWDQYFLGVRPDMLSGRIDIQPRIPSVITSLDQRVSIADGALDCKYATRPGGRTEYRYEWTASREVTLSVSIGVFAPVEVTVPQGGLLTLSCSPESITARLYASDGTVLYETEAEADPHIAALHEEWNRFFEGTDFAAPNYRENLKSLSRYFDPPLDYQSIE